MIVFCFTCFRCPAVCSVLFFTFITLNASQTRSYAWHAHNSLHGCTVERGCMHTGVLLCSLLFFVFLHFFLYCCFLPVFCFLIFFC
ncbi:mucin-associated surface protein (MASP) [Trypanosoma cruzi Dm28c]|uniref:Mucin-associated surface protein (MASP) n=1 Tax=Trypanosoma cruzi Dm28c TaxID=1416333 RepID=V5BAV8_TRYCR|nr:mucin-associated surface protein (MASP) [Trypanosoma cruzi Dm28c]